jgi:hypothetical protein
MTQRQSFLPGPTSQILKAVLALGGMFWMAHYVDQGTPRTWPLWLQGVWFMGMMVLMSIGVRPILRAQGMDERFAWMPIVIPFWLAAVILVGVLLKVLFGLAIWSTVIGAHAAAVAWGNWRRSWWFWEDWRAQWLRGIIGDAGARFVYAIAAILLAVLAIQAARH